MNTLCTNNGEHTWREELGYMFGFPCKVCSVCGLAKREEHCPPCEPADPPKTVWVTVHRKTGAFGGVWADVPDDVGEGWTAFPYVSEKSVLAKERWRCPYCQGLFKYGEEALNHWAEEVEAHSGRTPEISPPVTAQECIEILKTLQNGEYDEVQGTEGEYWKQAHALGKAAMARLAHLLKESLRSE